MPSSYSPLLRFEEIGAGEQSGLWGDTTNKNLGTLVEQAIAGVTTVSLSGPAGDYTLSALNGAKDEARAAVLKFIGSPSGPKNIIIPTSTKLYVVRNDCGQTISVKTAAQVTGVTLLNGEATLVFCDGTNAVAGIATAGVGPTTVFNGGTGATSFTGGFVKSPGGTGILFSSATVNLATEVTGVLPPANGGTGSVLPVTTGGTGTTLAPSAGQVLIGTNAGTYTPAFLTQGTGVTITPSSGGITISATGSVSGVASFNTRTGPVTLLSSDVTGALGYTPVSSSALSGYAQLSATNNFTGTNNYSTSGSIDMSASNNGDQRVKVTGGGYSSGMSPIGIQTGLSNHGIIYTPSTSSVDVVVTGYIASFRSSGAFQSNNSPNWATVSDQNIKTNLRPINNALGKLTSLNPCHFEYKDEIGKTRSGFIAQEFETVFPGHTTETGVPEKYKDIVPAGVNKIKALDLNLVPYLVKAIQELKADLDEAKAEIAALKAQ